MPKSNRYPRNGVASDAHLRTDLPKNKPTVSLLKASTAYMALRAVEYLPASKSRSATHNLSMEPKGSPSEDYSTRLRLSMARSELGNTIGIDKISNKKGYQDFIGIISAINKAGELVIIAVLDDRKKETVIEFFEPIPEHLKKTVKTVCTDMYDGFVYPAIEVFGQQAVVVDRYHVSKLYRNPLDKLRIKEMDRIKSGLPQEEYAKIEGMMWILRKQHECLTKADKTTLSLLYKYSPKLK